MEETGDFTLPRDWPTRIVMAGFAGILLALVVFLFHIGRVQERDRLTLSRIIIQRASPHSMRWMAHCLDASNGGFAFDDWQDEGEARTSFDPANKVGARIAATPQGTNVQISTLEARPLRAAEQAIVDRCLPPPR
jgi:hypothetical protein